MTSIWLGPYLLSYRPNIIDPPSTSCSDRKPIAFYIFSLQLNPWLVTTLLALSNPSLRPAAVDQSWGLYISMQWQAHGPLHARTGRPLCRYSFGSNIKICVFGHRLLVPTFFPANFDEFAPLPCAIALIWPGPRCRTAILFGDLTNASTVSSKKRQNH